MAPHADVDMSYSDGAADRGGEPREEKAPVFTVNSKNVQYTDDFITSKYTYHTSAVEKKADGTYIAQPIEVNYTFQTERHAPEKLGVMVVGLGGNNGTTIAHGIAANRLGLQWETREGLQAANWYGSVVMSSTVKLGADTTTGEEIFVPLNSLVPIAEPENIVIGGWDINNMNLAEAAHRAKVLQPSLKHLLAKQMSQIVPLPSPYYPTFIAANQGERANNVLEGSKACQAHVDQIRKDIQSVTTRTSMSLR